MFVRVVMTLLCTAGIGFYVPFLVALFKERKPILTGYLIRLKFDAARPDQFTVPFGELPVRKC